MKELMTEQKLNSWVAIMVALTATFMALCSVKDGNIVQNMYQAQFKSVDYWNYYQSKNNKQEILESTVEILLATKRNELTIQKLKDENLKLDSFKLQLKAKAEYYDKLYDDLNKFDDQFDFIEALFSLSLALLGISSLTQKRWLLFFSIGAVIVGIFLAITAFCGINIHFDSIANILS